MPIIVPNLTFHKSEAINEIKLRISEERLKYITDMPGQEAIYQDKRLEALDYIAAGSPTDLTDYPMLQSEVGITASTAYELAQMWLNLNLLWKSIASSLEGIRMTANVAVEASQNRTEINAALAQFHATMDAL